MSFFQIALRVGVALLAFAGNSILCRLALKTTSIDAASFTSVRLVSGAMVLAVLLQFTTSLRVLRGSWWGAGALFAYAALFSLAYLQLNAGTGALVLFGAVQVSMLGYSLARGERLGTSQWLGLLLAVTGLSGCCCQALQRHHC